MDQCAEDDRWDDLLEAAISTGQPSTQNAAQFDRGCDHVVQLLQDAAILLRNGSAPSAAFLSIAAIEETVKLHVSMFRSKVAPAVSRTQDPLFRHGAKTRLAAAGSIPMGDRLPKAIGREQLAELMGLARSGELAKLRETCLYMEREAQRFRVPADVVNKARARSLLLFSIEVFDDSLVGLTNHSFDLGRRTDELFSEVASF